MYQNRATLIGFLGKDAEVKTSQSNTSYTIPSLVTKRSWRDRKTGERQSQTTWHRCIVFGKKPVDVPSPSPRSEYHRSLGSIVPVQPPKLFRFPRRSLSRGALVLQGSSQGGGAL